MSGHHARRSFGKDMAWDISKAKYLQSGPLEYPENGRVLFSGDGLKMYVLRRSSKYLDEYSLSAPYDILNLQHEGIATLPYEAYGLTFNSDGTKLLTVDAIDDVLREYTVSTPWDLNSVSYVTSKNFSNGSGIYVSPSEDKLFVASANPASVVSWESSDVFNINTLTHVTSADVGSFCVNTADICFKPDGKRMFLVDYNHGKAFYQADLTTPWDISTIEYKGVSLDFSPYMDYPRGIEFTPDGSRLFMVGNQPVGSDDIFEFKLK